MHNRTQTDIMPFLGIIGRLLFISLLILAVCTVKPVHAQTKATPPTVSVTGGAVHIGSGDFNEYKPPHSFIRPNDSIEEKLTGNLNPGTDASGNECTLDPNNPPVWSWTYTTTYSSDNTNYNASDSNASISGGQNATLFATFATPGYYRVQFQAEVVFYTSCSSGKQVLDTKLYTEDFSVDGRDFDFSVTDVAINQGESGTFISNLTSINSFSGKIDFTNPDATDKLFGVTGSGILPKPGAAPITIGVGGKAKVGHTYIVGVRGTGTAGGTELYHDRTVNVTVLKRGVLIDALGTTFHKGINGKPEKDANKDGSTDGVTHNTVKQNALQYTATYTGFWGQNSSYGWYSAVGSVVSADHGTFNPDVIYGLLVDYSDTQFSPNEHIHITLTDVDNAPGHKVTGNYYVQWHDILEKSGKEILPAPLQKTDKDDSGKELAEPTIWITGGGPTIPVDIQEHPSQEYSISAGLEGGASIASLFGEKGEAASKALELLAHLAELNDLKWKSNEIPKMTVRNDAVQWEAVRKRVSLQDNCPPNVKALLNLQDGSGYYGFALTDMRYCLVKYYHHRTWPCDAYDTTGYIGSATGYVDVPDHLDMQPFYRYDPGPPATGGEGG